MVEFPQIVHDNDEYRVVYYEKNADQVCNFFEFKKLQIIYKNGEILRVRTQHALIDDVDWELGLENLVETKHTLLTRTARSAAYDRGLKPNAATRDLLEHLINTPPAIAPLSPDQVRFLRIY